MVALSENENFKTAISDYEYLPNVCPSSYGSFAMRGGEYVLFRQRRNWIVIFSQDKPSCLVLGGGGFLGINLCRRLASRGYRVRAFGRSCAFPKAIDSVEWCQGSFSNPIQLAAAIRSSEIVFHLIHSAPPNAMDQEISSDIQSDIISTICLLDICRKLQVKRIVYVSSAGTVYGNAVQTPTPESAATEPISAYGISKLAIEKYLAHYNHLYSLDYRILRVTNPFGPFQVATKNQGLIAALISRALRGDIIDIWGDGTAVRDFIYIDDVMDALERAAFIECDPKIFNIGSGVGRAVNDVLSAVEIHLEVKLKVAYHQKRILDVTVSTADIRLAMASLGWAPSVGFEEGLQRTIHWWKNGL